MSVATQQLSKYIALGKAQFNRFSAREKTLVLVTFFGMVFWGFFELYEPVKDIFQKQKFELEAVDKDLLSVSGLLERYVSLKAQRDAIEKQNAAIAFEEGVKTFLEELKKKHLGDNSRLDIKDLAISPFGTGYELAPFSVSIMNVTNLPGFVNMLKEMIEGNKALSVSELDMKKAGASINVRLEVISIRKASG